ncbi:reverse transcriptase domain-containing protein [Tanacetum coccineum]
MEEEDEEITAFPTEHGTFCYEKMTFGLKNAEATSQRSVYQAFIKQLGSNIEIYVDDMVIKSKSEGSMIADIEETFATLRRMNMKLNLKKYIFGVKTSQFLGHMITKEGIEVNPDKVKAIEAISSVLMAGRYQAQNPIYYVSKALQGLERNEPLIEIFFVSIGAHNKKPASILPGPPSLRPHRPTNSTGYGAGFILTDPYGKEVTYALRFEFPTSNNKAKYEALIDGLKLAIRLDNKRADALSKLASSSFVHLTKNVLVEAVEQRSIDIREVNTTTKQEETWMSLIIEYLKTRNLPADPTIARKIRIKAPQYTIKQDVLYGKGYLTPWLQCVGPKQASYVLQDVYIGSCEAHAKA